MHNGYFHLLSLTFSFTISRFKRFFSQEASQYAFPQLPFHTRMKQLWLVVWFESNKILEQDYGYTDDYFRSLNGKFNGSISYRSDSFVPNHFYAHECQYIQTTNPGVTVEKWREYEQSVLSKRR